jgi:hypothetical protein
MAEKVGPGIKRIAAAFEAGRDGFWLARWLRARGTDAHVIPASSRGGATRSSFRTKTDRLDTARRKRAFLVWRRGEREHGKLAAIPTIAEEDARQPSREPESLVGEHGPIVNGMKAAWRRSVSGTSILSAIKLLTASKTCARPTPTASRSRPTRCLRDGATWSFGGWSCSKYGNARPLGSRVSRRRPRRISPHTRLLLSSAGVPLGASRGTRIAEKV